VLLVVLVVSVWAIVEATASPKMAVMAAIERNFFISDIDGD
jgi:hypothetical protein